MSETNMIVTILAGGLGTRMDPNKPKVLFQVNGEIMIVRIIKKVLKLNPSKIIIVVGKYYKEIQKCITEHIKTNIIIYAVQENPLGTGNAVLSTLKYLIDYINLPNLIINGDTPLIKTKTLNNIVTNFINKKSSLLTVGIYLNNPTNYGRIVTDPHTKIVEEVCCSDLEKTIKLVNTGIYVVNNGVLLKIIPLIKNNNIKKEYYLTDMLLFTNSDVYILENSLTSEIININTKEDLSNINKKLII